MTRESTVHGSENFELDQRTVRCWWRPVGTVDEKEIQFLPPQGWFVDEVLPAFSDNGAGVVFVMRPVPGGGS